MSCTIKTIEMHDRSMPAVRWIGEPRLTAGLDRHRRLKLGAHRAVHGPQAALPVGALVALTKSVDARGRGGAAFPFARKLEAVARAARRGRPSVVVVNAMEGEPGSAKDRMLLTRTPHLVLDGAFLAAHALGAREIVVGVAVGSPGQTSMAAAIAERGGPGVEGCRARLEALPERFVSGEAGALVRGLNGGPALPPGRKRHASDGGLGGDPTLLSNAETFAQLAVLARLGPAGYAALGTAREPGTVLLSVGGAAARPAVVEAPAGTALTSVLRACGAGVEGGVLVGGYHGAWLTPQDAARVGMSRAELTVVGGTLGAGIVLPLGSETCALGEVARVAAYLGEESSGQCGPCRLGLPAVAQLVAALADGTSGPAAAIKDLRRALGRVEHRGACSHPDGTARFVRSALEVFAAEIAMHGAAGSCGRPVRGVLPVPAEPGAGQLVIDWTRCQGHGLCAAVAPELIRLDDDGFPVMLDASVPARLYGKARQAVDKCPALALRLDTGARRVPATRRERASSR